MHLLQRARPLREVDLARRIPIYSDLEEDKTPEEDPRDEVGDKIYFTKQEILENLQVNSPRGRPLKLVKDHLAN